MANHDRYCPFCQRHISPETDEDGELIKYEDYPGDPAPGFLYVHDDVPHDDDYTFEDIQ